MSSTALSKSDIRSRLAARNIINSAIIDSQHGILNSFGENDHDTNL
jgi:hypothetical protein